MRETAEVSRRPLGRRRVPVLLRQAGLLTAAGAVALYGGLMAAGKPPPSVHALPGLVPAAAGLAYGPVAGLAGGAGAAVITAAGLWGSYGWPWPAPVVVDWMVAGLFFVGLGVVGGTVAHLRYYRTVELLRLVRELRRARQQLEALYESGKLITSELDLERLITRLVRLVRNTFGYSHPAILLVDEERKDTLRLVGAAGYDAPIGMTIGFDQGITGFVARTGLAVRVDDVRRDPRYVPGIRECMSEVAVPIRIKGRVLGVLNVESPRLSAFTEEDEQVLQAIADQAAVAIQNARLLGLTAQMAITDGLTELYNHRHFSQQLEIAVERARRMGSPVSVVLLDIDDFKMFNDRFGHLVGDEVLRQIGRLIRQSVRRTDLAARYGGEEFVLLLPDTGTDDALRLARRIQQAVPRAESFVEALTRGGPGISLSAGVATFPDHAESARDLLRRADEACYQAKRSGKNQVVVWEAQASNPA
ncbi:sensor domain-containing diguanylate cyclase [Carboxydochorda subterranea]|uniref:Sensor domain-containing diguanylate cyclase n=1 Tax=Carboxydichorda subterranea TaxID=3109565 RepID=A0ABZ1BZ56_9FIRM|nr:sensor domain-containing diguanylate cyclase [Limnochorda sp. L945t]WRP17810.1 sensor domain-containing diguanylate cyclase [Limnochorda sp. L945t]